MRYTSFLLTVLLPVLQVLHSCSPSAPGIFGKKTPHEQYGQKLTNAGLRETTLGRSWFSRAEESLRSPLPISVPYKETGFFSSERPEAAGFLFEGTRGERLQISLDKKPVQGFSIYMDLWELTEADSTRPKWIASSDTSNKTLEYDIKKKGNYLLRIQPELLSEGEYTLSILSGPSLAFPVPAARGRVGSLWGDNRDGGGRKHEGIDIFAAFRSPVIAATDGVVTAVNTNNLGGKVVWLNTRDANYTLYYAHLDEQIATPGQVVKKGDTLGLIGNTGNARNTPPHLHFGIYTTGGPIDPLPFVKPRVSKLVNITAPLNRLGKQVRSTGRITKLQEEPEAKSKNDSSIAIHTLLNVQAATGQFYKVSLPNGERGYIAENAVTGIDKPVQQFQLIRALPLLSQPLQNAPRKAVLKEGTKVDVLGSFGGFQLIRNANGETGWIGAR
ncbi:MAG: M23 family metallopeptidase [Chitinophagaceae bacterium]|nr:M23 family metallopeptidase [Chitinophagaceae bacterium]